MKKIYFFVTGFLFAHCLLSQISQINDPFMYGGRTHAVAFNANCALAGTTGGIFKTTNNGVSWTNASNSFNAKTLDCNQIVNIGNTFYAQSNSEHGPSIYKSNDDGANWSRLSFSDWSPQAIGKLANTLYVVGINYMTGGKLYASTDGVNWAPKAVLWTTQWQGGNCQLYHFDSDKMYLLLNGNLYYTTDGNTMSTVSANGLGSSSFDGDYDIDGDAAGNLFYLTNNSIFKYNFNTDIWQNISTGKIPADYQIINLSVTSKAVFCSAMTPMVGMKLFKSADGGATFNELKSTTLQLPMVERISETSANGLIGFDLNAKILLSADDGSTWYSTNDQYIASYTGNLVQSGQNLLFSAENKGVVRSTDAGNSWTNENTGIPIFGNIAYFVEQLISVKDTLFSFVKPEPFTDQLTLYKSNNGGNTWLEKPIPAPFNNGEDYEFAGKCDSALFVSYWDPGTTSYALIASFKNGNSWVKPNNLNNQQRIYLQGPSNCLFAFFGTNNSWEDFTNVYQANNFGMSFSDINPNQLFGYDFCIKRSFDDRGEKGDAIMDFNLPGNFALFAVNDRRMGNDIDHLYKYDISTSQWSEIVTQGLPDDYQINCIRFLNNNRWLMATNAGLYLSTNGGANWKLTHDLAIWQTGIKVTSMQVIGNNVFMGTVANGLWINDLSTGFLERIFDPKMTVYPNPAGKVVNIQLPDSENGLANIQLFGSDGKQILSQTSESGTIQIKLPSISKGNYYITVRTKHNFYRKPVLIR